MNKLNGNTLIGSPHSIARKTFAKHFCLDCMPKDKNNDVYYEYELARTGYCEVCEKELNMVKNRILITNLRGF